MKRILAVFLSIVMILSVCNLFAFAEDGQTTITAYITISRYGEFVSSKNNQTIISLPVELTGNESYTLDDAFKSAHDLYYEGGAVSGYASDTGEWGAYITKFWGDESGKFGYQVNSGTESVMGLSHGIENGDFIEVCIYKNSYPNTENYATFDMVKAETFINEEVEITLNAVSGYDEDSNMIFSPCENATITINGQATEIVTDADGKATLAFDAEGKYIVSATKTQTVNDAIIPAITAPVCVVEVKMPDSIKVIHNIAKKYSQSGVTSDVNMLWLIADMEVYSQLYPQSDNVLTNRQVCLDKVIAFAETATTPGDLSKAIIAARALGYDAKNMYTSASRPLDAVGKLTALIDAENEDVLNPYTLPYVIIALHQGAEYATDAQMEYLLNAAISTKEDWQNLEYGPDAAAPMLLALAPYYENNADIAAAIDETLPLIEGIQTESGLIDSWGPAASTGLVIAAYSALGIDAESITNENNLIDGLMTECTETLDAFNPLENTFSTEQGFRGLLAYQLFKTDSPKILYDFSDYPMTEARATVPVSTPVFGGGSISSTPEEEPEEEPKEEPQEELQEEIQETTFSEDTFSDVKSSDWHYKSVEYVYKNNLMQGTDNGFEPDSKMTRAMLACVIYRMENPEKVFDNNIFEDVKSGEWYTDAIAWAASNGIVNGVNENEFAPNENVTREQMAVIIFRYAKFKNINLSDYENTNIAKFDDFDEISEYASSALSWANGCGIINGETESRLNPQNDATRAQVATILMRFCEGAK